MGCFLTPKALHQIRRYLGNCCIGSTVSCKTCPERGDAAELVPLTLHGVLDRFDSAAGLCHEEKQFVTERGVPVRVLQIQTQHFSAVERIFFIFIHTYTRTLKIFFHSASAQYKLLTADKKFASLK